MNSARSTLVSSAPGIAEKNRAQPVLLSNFILDLNSGWPQPAQVNVPLPYSLLSGLVKRRSVPSSRTARYCSGVSDLRHSCSDFVSLPMSLLRCDKNIVMRRTSVEPGKQRACLLRDHGGVEVLSGERLDRLERFEPHDGDEF